LLKELHILTREGKLNQDSRRKLKQVYHLFGFIEKLLLELADQPDGITLADHGAGKSYLGFILYDLFFKALCIGSRSEFLETLLDVIDSGQRRLSDFNRIVFEAAQIGDPQAIGILQKMGTRYAQCINAVVGELAFDEDAPLEIVLAGSLFVRGESPAAIETLQKMVRETHPGREIAFSILTHPPVAGAVLWALEGFHVEDAFSKVVRQF